MAKRQRREPPKHPRIKNLRSPRAWDGALGSRKRKLGSSGVVGNRHIVQSKWLVEFWTYNTFKLLPSLLPLVITEPQFRGWIARQLTAADRYFAKRDQRKPRPEFMFRCGLQIVRAGRPFQPWGDKEFLVDDAEEAIQLALDLAAEYGADGNGKKTGVIGFWFRSRSYNSKISDNVQRYKRGHHAKTKAARAKAKKRGTVSRLGRRGKRRVPRRARKHKVARWRTARRKHTHRGKK